MRRLLESVFGCFRAISPGFAQRPTRKTKGRRGPGWTESLEVRQLLTGAFAWGNTLGTALDERAMAVETDTSGNVYTVGNFSGTVDFDSGPGVFALTSSGLSDLFITKVNGQGSFLWARQIGGSGGSAGQIKVDLDSAGNLFATGSFTGTVDFDPASGVVNLFSAGSSDVFVLKLNTSGNLVWARRMGGDRPDQPATIALDTAGNVITTGSYAGTADFDPGPGVQTLTAGNDGDIFVSKLDNNGNFIWARRIGGNQFEFPADVAVDPAGNIVTVGEFSGTVDFNPGTDVNNLSGVGTTKYVLKLDSSGNYVWARRFGGTGSGSISPAGVAVDAAGNVLSAGRFSSTIDFNPGTIVTNLSSAGQGDIYVSKLDSSGNFVWARRMGGNLEDRAGGISLDSSGNVVTTGYFQNTVDFDPGAGVRNLISAGNTDIFVSKLDSNGNFAWARRIGGVGRDEANEIAIDINNNALIAGSFQGTVDLDPGSTVSNRTSLGQSDAFTVKLTPDMLFDLSGRSGDVKLVRNGDMLQLFFNGTMTAGLYLLMEEQPIGQIRSVRVSDPQGLPNSLTVDSQAGGVFGFSGGIHFSGGSGASDRIRLIGLSGQSAWIRQPSAANGLNQLLIDNEPITFSGTEGVVITGITTLRVVTPKSADVLTLKPALGINGAVGSGVSGTSGGVSILPLTFHHVPNVIVDTGANDASESTGNDVVTIDQGGLKAVGLQNLTIQTGQGKDKLSIKATNIQLGAAGGAFRFLGGSQTNHVEAIGNTNWTLSNTILAAGGGGVLQMKDVQSSSITGGNGNNILNASSFDGTVTLNGLGGNDVLRAARSSSVLNGGDGDDLLFGGLSSDVLNCGSGADQLFLSGTNMADHLTLQRTSSGGVFRRRSRGTGALQETDTITAAGSLNITIRAFDGDDLIAIDSLFSHRGTVDGGLGLDTCTAPRHWTKISC